MHDIHSTLVLLNVLVNQLYLLNFSQNKRVDNLIAYILWRYYCNHRLDIM